MAHNDPAAKPTRRDNEVVEYADSVAQRPIQPKKYGAQVGYIMDPFRMRKVGFESGLEDKVVHYYAAHHRTLDLREQQVARYRSGTGLARHWFDLVRTRTDGRRIAYAVKYAEDVDDELRHVLEAVASFDGDHLADEYRILTETHLDETSIANARLVCACAGDHDREALEAVRRVLPCEGEWTTFGDIADDSGFGLRGYRAAVALVQSGRLSPERGRLIDHDAVAIGRKPTIATSGFTR